MGKFKEKYQDLSDRKLVEFFRVSQENLAVEDKEDLIEVLKDRGLDQVAKNSDIVGNKKITKWILIVTLLLIFVRFSGYIIGGLILTFYYYFGIPGK